jgi:hypothetical protein
MTSSVRFEKRGDQLQITVEQNGPGVGAHVSIDGGRVTVREGRDDPTSNRTIGVSIDQLGGPEKSTAPVKSTSAEDRKRLTKQDLVGEAMANKIHLKEVIDQAPSKMYDALPELRAQLSELTLQQLQALRQHLIKTNLLGEAPERSNPGAHPAAQGPVTVEKLMAIIGGEAWYRRTDGADVKPEAVAEVPKHDRALWEHRLSFDPDLRKIAERDPAAFGAAAEALEYHSMGRTFTSHTETLAWWAQGSKEDARALLEQLGSNREAWSSAWTMRMFYDDVFGARGPEVAKDLGFSNAAALVSHDLRNQLNEVSRGQIFDGEKNKLALIDAFGLETLKKLSDQSRDLGVMKRLSWYTMKNDTRREAVKAAIDRGEQVAKPLEQLMWFASTAMPGSSLALLSKLDFPEARKLAEIANDFTSPGNRLYGFGELDRLGPDETLKRLGASKGDYRSVVSRAASEREQRSIESRARADASLARASTEGARDKTLAGKMRLFQSTVAAHATYAENPLPLEKGEWRDPMVGPGSPLFQRIGALRGEIMTAIGKEEAPKIIASAKKGPEELRRAVWSLMDRLEPIADPTPQWSYGGLSLADLKPIADLLPSELSDGFAKALNAGRPPLRIDEGEIAKHTARGEPLAQTHATFRTRSAIADLYANGGEGIFGYDRRTMEAAFAGPFADGKGEYVLAAFSDRGAMRPGDERLPELLELRATDKPNIWSAEGGAIELRTGKYDLGLIVKSPYRSLEG